VSVTYLRRLIFLPIILALAGCAAAEPPATVAGAVSTVAPVELTLPPPATPTAARPTPTATRVATWTPTATATATSSPTPQPTATATPEPPQIEHVVIISIDGLRADALARADTPNLDALRKRGAFSDNARAVVPSVTLVSHASMLGGMSPEKHGVTWNIFDAERGFVNGPTLFSLAHNAGLRTAMVVGKEKLQHLAIPGTVDEFDYPGFNDLQVGEKATQMIAAGLPAVLFVHLPGVDTAGHHAGWMSDEQIAAVQLADAVVGDVTAALDNAGYSDSTLLIVTSDHGGSGKSHGSDSPEDTRIPWLAVGPGVSAGYTLPDGIVVFDTAATAARALNLPLPAEWDGQPVPNLFE